MDHPSDGTRATAEVRQRSDFYLYLTVAAPIFFGLFFLEYPPLFLYGYWSWSGLVHKTLSGIFLILNLAVAELAVRRSRSRGRAERQAATPGPREGRDGSEEGSSPPQTEGPRPGG